MEELEILIGSLEFAQSKGVFNLAEATLISNTISKLKEKLSEKETKK